MKNDIFKPEFLTQAEYIVRKAGCEIKRKNNLSRILSHKENDDLVTDGDILVENIILDFIKEKFPDHGFDSEEEGIYKPESEYIWILDPIDGTKYFARGLPLYTISLALEYQKKTILGIVYLPETDHLYCAAYKRGSTLNGKRIQCSTKRNIKDYLICLEIPTQYSSQARQEWAYTILGKLINASQRIRIIGVGSIGLCFTAMGGFDAYINLADTWKKCDIAAGKIILTEAGGKYHEINRVIIGSPVESFNELKVLIDPEGTG